MPKRFVFKTSLPGIDAETASPEQCSLHSDYGNQKTKIGQDPEHFGVTEYTFTSNPADGTTTNIITVPHGYSYVPSCRAFGYAIVASSGWEDDYYTELPFYPILSSSSGQLFTCYCDLENFKIDLIVNDPGGTRPDLTLTQWSFKYYIFAENGVAE